LSASSPSTALKLSSVVAICCSTCTVLRTLFHEIDAYVIVRGSNAPCQPALRVGQ